MTIQERKWLEEIMRKKLEDKITSRQLTDLMCTMWEAFTEMDAIEENVAGNSGHDELLKVFLQAKKIEGRTEKTVERYDYIIRRFLTEAKVPAGSVTVYHLRKYFADELERGISENSIRGYQNIFSSFFGWLWREGLIQNNPCGNIGTIKVPKLQKKPYTSVELEQIKDACTSIRDKTIVCFLASTGCRIEETTKLNRNDIDFINKECTVYGKGQKERTAYIDEITAALLIKYFAQRKDSSIALFPGRSSDRLTAGGIRRMLKEVEKRSGVTNVHPHRFRRTLATNLARRGMSIQEVAAILGHEKVTTTMEYVCVEKAAVKHHYQTIAM